MLFERSLAKLCASESFSFMCSLLNISIYNVDGNIKITTQEVAEEPTKQAFDLLVEEADSIVSLLAPFLDGIWDPISKLITPKCIVVKLVEVEINSVCRELYCHFLDLDWPLIQLDISPLGANISERDALRMAVSYYKHKDRHTQPENTIGPSRILVVHFEMGMHFIDRKSVV